MIDGDENNVELTDHEAELYDRQIRLWGLESQKRLRSAKILLIGLNGLGAEVGKNIILAGVKSITFLDQKSVSLLDVCSQFLVPRDRIGNNRAEASLQRAQDLNPMVAVDADAGSVDDKPDEFFMDFDVICAIECTITQIKRLNKIARENNIKFFAGDVWGTFGYTFADLGIHEFAEDIVQAKRKSVSGNGEARSKNGYENITITVRRKETFVPFEEILDVKTLPKDAGIYHLLQILLNYRERHGKDPDPKERSSNSLKSEIDAMMKEYDLGDMAEHFSQGDIYSQISPVCAILGGVMGQEIIKAVSQKGAPHNNVFLFNPVNMCGQIFKLGN